MAKTVSIRYTSYLPGQGRNGNGQPVQGKQEVSGRIAVTSLNGGGESLLPSDLGLTAIDHIDLRVTAALSSKSGAPRTAEYDYTSQEFYVLQDASTTNTSGKNFTLTFQARGDSAGNVEHL